MGCPLSLALSLQSGELPVSSGVSVIWPSMSVKFFRLLKSKKKTQENKCSSYIPELKWNHMLHRKDLAMSSFYVFGCQREEINVYVMYDSDLCCLIYFCESHEYKCEN